MLNIFSALYRAAFSISAVFTAEYVDDLDIHLVVALLRRRVYERCSNYFLQKSGSKQDNIIARQHLHDKVSQ